MNNLHRELAPVSDAAWAQIEQEVARTFRRNLAGRRVVDVKVAESGRECSAIGTGHLKALKAPQEGVIARQRIVMPLVELRVPFDLSREAVDDVERGADDSDWQPAKDAAEQLAYAEDRAIFLGYAAAGIRGVREGTSNPVLTLPAKAMEYPDAVAAATPAVNAPPPLRVPANDGRPAPAVTRHRRASAGDRSGPTSRR